MEDKKIESPTAPTVDFGADPKAGLMQLDVKQFDEMMTRVITLAVEKATANRDTVKLVPQPSDNALEKTNKMDKFLRGVFTGNWDYVIDAGGGILHPQTDRPMYGEMARAINSTTNAAGGFLIPPDVRTDVIRIMELYGLARKYCNVVQTSANKVSLDFLLTGVQVYVAGEAVAGTESNPTFGQTTVTPSDIQGLSVLTNQILNDGPNLYPTLTKLFAEAYLQQEDTFFLTANGGANVFIGMFNVVQATAGTTDITVSASTTFQTTYRDWLNIIGSLQQRDRQGAVLFCSPSVQMDLMSIVDLQGRPMWIPAANNNLMNQFMGFPIELSELCPASTSQVNGATGTGTVFAVLTNPKNNCFLVDRGIMTVDLFNEGTIGSTNLITQRAKALSICERVGFLCQVPVTNNNKQTGLVRALLA